MFTQKLLQLLKDPPPTSAIPITLHRGGHVQAHVERYLATPEGRAALDVAEAHWRHWQSQKTREHTQSF